MKFYQTLFERKASITHLALIALLSVVMLASKDYIYNPLSEAANYIFKKPFFELKLALSDVYQVRQRNSELEEALLRAMVQINDLKRQKSENERLRAQLGYSPAEDFRLIPLEAYSVTYRGIPVAIQVNKGTAQGLSSGQPVISGNGLVGRIDELSARFATVQLLSDPGCRVAARDAESREQGIVRFVSSRGLILDNVPIDGQIKTGDLIISSGLGGVFPEGLPVGIVESVTRDENAIFASVSLKPVVNLNAIDELYALAQVSDTVGAQKVLNPDEQKSGADLKAETKE